MGPNEWRGGGGCGRMKHQVKLNKLGGQNKRGGMGNFDEIKRKGLFVSETKF